MQRLFIVFLMVLGAGAVFAQSAGKTSPISLTATVFNIGSTLPGGGDLLVTSTPVHPGISLGAEYIWRHNGHHSWLQTARLGYFYHEYSEHAVQLYTEVGYRFHFGQVQRFALEARLGGGYLHAISDLQQFELNADGIYAKKEGIGRPQGMVGLGFGPQYTFNIAPTFPLRIFLDYQFFVQTPFVKKYVPILPYTALHVGVGVPVSAIF